MKTIRVSDKTHKKLTEILGKLMAETGKMQTYENVINTLIAVYYKNGEQLREAACGVNLKRFTNK